MNEKQKIIFEYFCSFNELYILYKLRIFYELFLYFHSFVNLIIQL